MATTWSFAIPRVYEVALAEEGINGPMDVQGMSKQEAIDTQRRISERVGTESARRLPLGHGAYDPKDYRTDANRQAISSWLYRFFAGEFEQVQISLPLHRGEAKTGAELTAKIVTKAELDTSLAYLRWVHQDWFDVIHDYFQYEQDDVATMGRRQRRRRSMATVSKHTGWDRRAVSEKIDRGLDVLIDYHWKDVR